MKPNRGCVKVYLRKPNVYFDKFKASKHSSFAGEIIEKSLTQTFSDGHGKQAS